MTQPTPSPTFRIKKKSGPAHVVLIKINNNINEVLLLSLIVSDFLTFIAELK